MLMVLLTLRWSLRWRFGSIVIFWLVCNTVIEGEENSVEVSVWIDVLGVIVEVSEKGSC